MTDELVKLVSCRDVIEAETIRIRLESAGIAAVVQGGEVATTLSYMGAAVGYPKVEVPEQDFQRAVAILDDDRIAVATAGAWTCTRCGEHNEPAFDVCWSCNKTRSSDDAPASSEPIDQFERQTKPTHASLFAPSSSAQSSPAESHKNPYRPIAWANDQLGSQDVTPVELPLTRGSLEEEKREVNRALLAAIAGIIFPIALFTLYSLILLLRLGSTAQAISLRTNAKFYTSWAINLIVVAVSVGLWIAQ